MAEIMSVETHLSLPVDPQLRELSQGAIAFAVSHGLIAGNDLRVIQFEVENKDTLRRAVYCGQYSEIHGLKFFVGVTRTDSGIRRVIDILANRGDKIRVSAKIALNGSGLAVGSLELDGDQLYKWSFAAEHIEVLLSFVREDLLSGRIKALTEKATEMEVKQYIDRKLQ